MRKPFCLASFAVAAAGLAAALAGCGSSYDVGKVSGTVTLDGEPLAGAVVTFSPTKGGAPSFGRTDASGKYTLQYTRDTAGAEIGEHSVSVSTHTSGDPDADPPLPASPEKVPTKYNVDTQLTKTVEPGPNTIDVVLDSEGEIVQPDEMTRPPE